MTQAARTRARRADPPPAGDRPALRRPPRRARRRPRRRARRAARHPRPERRRQDDAVQRHLRRRRRRRSGTIEFLGQDVTALPPRARAKLGMGRTYQKSRLVPRPLGRGQPLPRRARRAERATCARSSCRSRDGELRERARELARSSGSRSASATLVGSLSHGEQRQLEVGMARAVESDADDARRARLRPLARRARRADRAAARSSTRRSR